MFPYFRLLGMSLYDICLVVAILVALFLSDRMGIMRGFSVKLQKTLIISIISALVVGFTGAVLFQAVYNGIETGKFVIDVNTGMTFYGGLIFGVMGFFASWFGIGKIMCKDDEPVTKLWIMVDIAACVVPLAHGIGRIGCFTAGCCHGLETDAWYGVNMLTESGWMKVIPVQLFEAAFLFALSGVFLWLFFKKFGQEEARFPLLPIYVAAYGVWRFFIEYVRADDRGQTFIPFLSPSQLVAIFMVLIGIAYFVLWFIFVKKGNKKQEEIPANNETEQAGT